MTPSDGTSPGSWSMWLCFFQAAWHGIESTQRRRDLPPRVVAPGDRRRWGASLNPSLWDPHPCRSPNDFGEFCSREVRDLGGASTSSIPRLGFPRIEDGDLHVLHINFVCHQYLHQYLHIIRIRCFLWGTGTLPSCLDQKARNIRMIKY